MKMLKALLAIGAATSLVAAPAFAHTGHSHHHTKKARHMSASKKADSSMSNMSSSDMKNMDMKKK